MQWTEAYATTRQRLLAQAETFDDRAAKVAVPALPGWSVKDAYAHLTGVCADVLDGNLDGSGTPAWTARQVTERAERPLVAVCAEWSDRGAEIDGWLAAADARAAFLCYDVWSHEQDIRGRSGWRGTATMSVSITWWRRHSRRSIAAWPRRASPRCAW